MDFGTAVKNWRDTKHKAVPPRFHKKRRTGTGSFRAASGISQIKYNAKRRIQLPAIGSVKLRHTLPKSIVYEAHIKLLNGQWVMSVKMWQPPKLPQEPETRIANGAVDTGINPHANGQRGPDLDQPKGLLPGRTGTASLATCSGTPHDRKPRLVESPTTN